MEFDRLKKENELWCEQNVYKNWSFYNKVNGYGNNKKIYFVWMWFVNKRFCYCDKTCDGCNK